MDKLAVFIRVNRPWLLISLIIALLLLGALVGFVVATYLGHIIYRLI